jgi:hypothetical protein
VRPLQTRRLLSSRALRKAVGLFAAVLLSAVGRSNGATITAVSPSLSDVTSAIASASDGDTVVVPAGTATWSSTLTISNKNITLTGAGMDSTTGTTINETISTPGALLIWWATINSDFTARLSNMHIHMMAASSDSSIQVTMIQIGGTAKVHLNSSNAVVGGVRVDHVRITADSDTIASQNYVFAAAGWVTGVFDHNFLDYSSTASGAEIMDISQPTSSTGTTTPEGTRAYFGDWSWWKDYIYGGGLSNFVDASGQSITGNGDLDAIYLEDNIFHRNGIVLDSLKGGARIVARHNTTWGGLSGHGMETGNNAGVRAMEIYNNFTTAVTVTSFNPFACRSGGYVNFNNRITAWKSNPGIVMWLYRLSATVSMIGPGDGTNFFDLNERGTISYNGYTFTPVSTPSDTRIGSVYATGTASTSPRSGQFTLTGLDGGSTANKWAGFCIRNKNTAVAESLGGQSQTVDSTSWGLIVTSTATNPTTVTMQQGASGTFTLGSKDPWEIRRVNTPMNVPGSGKTGYLLNGGSIKIDPSDPALWADSSGVLLAAPNPRWGNQAGDGVWQWGNQYRASSTDSFANVRPLAGSTASFVPGGIHNDAVKPGYPTENNDITTDAGKANLRVGADWASPDERIEAGASNAATQAYGAPYPHPLRIGVVDPPINISPDPPTNLRVVF